MKRLFKEKTTGKIFTLGEAIEKAENQLTRTLAQKKLRKLYNLHIKKNLFKLFEEVN